MAQLLYNKAFEPDKFPATGESLIDTYTSGGEGKSTDDFILVVPTGKLVRKFEMLTVQNYFAKHGKPLTKPNIFTVQTFARHCFDKLYEDDYRLISDAYRLSLFEEAAEKADLDFYASGDRPPPHGVLIRLNDVVYGLREDGISLEDIHSDIEKPEKSADDIYDHVKLKDIAKLYEEYEKFLAGNLFDYPKLLNKLSELIRYKSFKEPVDELNLFENQSGENVLNSLFPNKPVILFYGFSEFRMPEMDFLSLFSQSEIPAAVHIDYSNVNGPLFGNLNDTRFKLEAAGFKNIPIDENDKPQLSDNPDNEIGKPRSTFLRRWLFNTEKNIDNPDFSDIIEIYSANNRLEEVKSIAKLIKNLSIEENIPLHEICVTMRQPDEYSTLFRELFASYEIPVNVSDRFPLASSPVVTAIFAVLDVISRGYKRADIHKALESPYLKFTSGDEEIDSANLLNTALRLRITGGNRSGGSKFWIKRLETAVESLKKRIERQKEDDTQDPMDTVQLERELQSTEKTLNDIKALIDIIPKKSKAVPPKDFSAIVKEQIIKNLGISENIRWHFMHLYNETGYANNDHKIRLIDEVEKDARALTAFIEILDEMCFIIADRHPGRKFSFDHYVEKIKTSVLGAKYQIREKQQYGVTVTSIEQTRGIPFRVMILCGAVDGEFPIAYTPERFLGKELNASEERHIRSERMQFYQFLTNGSDFMDAGDKKIFIFYPQNEERRELVRSQFIDDLLKITTLENDGRTVNISEQRGEIPWEKNIVGIGEVHEILGQALANPSEQNEKLKDKIRSEIKTRHIDKTGKLIESAVNRNMFQMFGGNIPQEKLLQAGIDKLRKLKEKPVSISALETYGKCPYKFFADRVLNFEEPEILDSTLSPLERGSMFHRVLYRFYVDLQKENAKKDDPALKPVILDRENYDHYRDKLFQIGREEMENIRFDHPFFELEERDLFGDSSKQGLLDVWLDEEFRRIDAGWEFSPALFEFSFGMKSLGEDKPINAVDLAEGLKLRGKVDRVELIDTGDELKFVIADYKTAKMSNIPSDNKIKDGLSFQMSLYSRAVQQILREKYNLEAQPDAAVYYLLRPEYDEKKERYASEKIVLNSKESYLSESYLDSNSRLPTPEKLIETEESSFLFAKKYIELASSGCFWVEPENNACKYCAFQPVCRIYEKRNYFM